MKIRVEMTAEEIAKGTEIIASIFPSIDVSQYMPTTLQEVDAKCNAYEMKNISDPETGICTEMEIKTHFIIWMLRKMKPFIATFMTLWHMFTDFFEDIQLMIGEVTILHNGEDLAAKLSKMARNDDYITNDEDMAERFVESSDNIESVGDCSGSSNDILSE